MNRRGHGKVEQDDQKVLSGQTATAFPQRTAGPEWKGCC